LRTQVPWNGVAKRGGLWKERGLQGFHSRLSEAVNILFPDFPVLDIFPLFPDVGDSFPGDR